MPEISTIQSAYGFLAPVANHTAVGTTAVYVAAAATTTKPTTGHGQLYSNNPKGPNLLVITPFSTAVSGQTSVGMRILGWSTYANGSAVQYIPTVLADFTLVTNTSQPSSAVGGNTVYFINSITQVAGTATANKYNPVEGTGTTASVDYATVVVDAIGSEYVTVQFKSSNASTAAYLGCLWRTI